MTPQLEFKVNGESIFKFKVDGGASGEKLRLVTPQLKFKVNGAFNLKFKVDGAIWHATKALYWIKLNSLGGCVLSQYS